MKTFSLSRHSRLFSVPDSSKEYLFVSSGANPYQEEPYRAESYAIVFIKEGTVKLSTGPETRDVQAPAIITLAPVVIRYFTKTGEILVMDVIFFKETFLLERQADLFFLTPYDFFENIAYHVLPLDEARVIKFSKIFELIHLTETTGTYHRAELIRNYIFALIYETDAFHRQRASPALAQKKADLLSAKFRQLLSRNYLQEHRLDFYAGQLNVTPKSLSAAVKKQTGRSAGKWIDDTIILEAKVLLQNKTHSVAQVSGMLHFWDQSVFGKFFRAGTGMSPLEYRKKLNWN